MISKSRTRDVSVEEVYNHYIYLVYPLTSPYSIVHFVYVLGIIVKADGIDSDIWNAFVKIKEQVSTASHMTNIWLTLSRSNLLSAGPVAGASSSTQPLF